MESQLSSLERKIDDLLASMGEQEQQQQRSSETNGPSNGPANDKAAPKADK